MADQLKVQENNRPKFSGRLLIMTILFFIPCAVLFYSTLGTKQLRMGFVTQQVSGYISFIFFLFIYIGIIKALTWFLAKIGVKWH